MLRNLRSITRDTVSVTEIVGLILMITIALVAATTVQVYLGGNGGNPRVPPMVSMKQSASYLTITNIQYGPVNKDSINFKVFDNDGNYICDGDFTSTGENLAGGDIITINCPHCPLTSGEVYFVLAIYDGSQVGREKYIAP